MSRFRLCPRAARRAAALAFVCAALGPAPAAVAVTAAPPAAPRTMLIVCSPGSPGDTLLAQPVMDGFASAVARAAGWATGSLGAIYFETEASGLARLASSDAALALVPLPFYLKHAAELDLEPRLQIATSAGPTETWNLAAKRGVVKSPEALAGWELTGSPGYAPAFVRGPVLGAWGPLPATARITFASAVLTPLRRSASGEKIAVILDDAQSAALPSLPFAPDLEIVARSRPLPATLLCTVGRRLEQGGIAKLVAALLAMPARAGDAEMLSSIRVARFVRCDLPALAAARRAFAAASGG